MRVSTTSDSAYEFNETFDLRLSNPTNARLWHYSRTTYSRATGTILDDDPPPTLSISDGSATEGDKVEFKVSLSAPTGRPVSVDVRPEVGPGDTATLFDDFDGSGWNFSSAGGTGSNPPSFTVRVVTTDDDLDETDETFTVRLSNPVGLILGDATATGTIIDDDDGTQVPSSELPTVGFRADPHVAEGGWMRFWVRLSKPSNRQISVQYRTSSGTARSGADFTPEAGLMVFPPGKTYEFGYVRTTRDDRLDEGNETFTLTLSNPIHATLGDATATATITEADTDADGSPFVAVKTSTDAVEGKPVTFTVRLSAPSAQTVTVQYQAQGRQCVGGGDCGAATSGVDYVATSGTLTFAPHHTVKTVSVPTTDDSAYEGTEYLYLKLSNPTNAVFRNKWSNRAEKYVEARILDNEAPVASFALQASSAQEDSGTHDVTVNLSPPPISTITLRYTEGSGTATSGSDYGLLPGTVRVASGATTATIPVRIIDDAVDDNGETIVLILTASTGYTVGANSRHTVTIRNHETATTPEISITAGPGVTEGGGATFTLTASPAPAAALTVAVTVTESGGYATAGTRQVTVPTGGTATFTVTTVDDSTDEPNGSVTATIGAGTGYTVSSSRGSATVAVSDDDDPPPAPLMERCASHLPSNAVSVAEVEGWRDAHAHDAAHVLRWNRVLAALGEEVGAGVSAMTVAEARANQGRYMRTRWTRVTATLEAIEACLAGSGERETPATPEVSISAGPGVTEGSGATFTLTASPAPAAALTVAVTVTESGGYATAGTRQVTVPTGGTATFTVATVDDSTDEPNGSVTATIGAGTGYTVSSSRGSATVAVSDDDDPPPAPLMERCASHLPSNAVSVAEVEGWRDAHAHDAAHVLRWNRVLAALGEEVGAGVSAMTVAEARANQGRYMRTRWTRVTATLEAIEACLAGSGERETPATPEFSISAGPGVTEGSGATFTLTASPAPAAALTVAVTVTESGGYATAGTRQVTVPTGGTATFTVATVDDSTDEPNGSVTATIGAGTGYTVSSSRGSATVAVSDNDDPPPATPEVSISAGTGVTEGSGATFTLTASPAPAAALTVAVTVTESGGYATAGTRQVTVPTGGTATFTVTTVDDGADEPDGSVTATLAAGTGYTVSASRGAATVAVADDDEPLPEVSISAGARVTEGAPAAFTLTANSAPAADLSVSVSVSQSGAFAQASALGTRAVTILAGQASASFTVATVDDDVDEPDGAVVAALGSGGGYTLGDAARATVAVADNEEAVALPAIVTKKGIAREGSDEAVKFRVRLERAASKTVTVDYATADGAGQWARTAPARAGADYTATSGTLAFAPGETQKTVSVPILDDAIDEGMEYFLLKFSNPQGATLAARDRETHGLIRNDDHLQAMWLARFGRTVGTQVTDAVSERLAGGLSPGAHVTLAGQSADFSQAGDGQARADALTGFGRAFGAPGANDDDPFARHGLGLSGAWDDPATTTAARSMTGRELLLGSSFHVAAEREGSGPGLAAWGRVAHDSFDGEHADDTGRTSVDGEVVTGVLGADADWGRLLAGVAVSLSEGKGKFDAPGADVGSSGRIESTMTTVSPYARFNITERVSAWGLAGWGTGDMTIRFDDGSMAPVRTDLSMQLGAIGARGALLTQDEAGGMDLALKADAFFVRMESEKAANSAETEADASRVRLVLEGGRRFALSDTATLRPTLELGLRQDGGDAETGTGFEVGGGVSYSDAASGLSLEAKARMLVAHADSDYEEWGASATARLDPGERGRGLSFSLVPTIGATSSASERLWGAQDARALTPGGEFEAARGLTAEAGYGMALFGDRFTGTPNLGFGMSDGGARDYRLGWRLTSAIRGDPGFEVNLDAVRREAANGNEPPEHGVMLRSLIRW